MKKFNLLILCIAVAMSSVVNAEVIPASLPFSFDGGKADVLDNVGMSYSGLGDDYKSSPSLKFDNTDDWMIIQVADVIGELKFAKRGYSTDTLCEFDIQTSVDGVAYNDFYAVPPTGSATGENRIIVNNFPSDVRYIRFYYTHKEKGNIAIGAIDITNGDETAASIITSPSKIDFGTVDINATTAEQTVTLTAANLTEDVTITFETIENNPFLVENTTITSADADGEVINITLNTATAGNFSNKLIFKYGDDELAQVALSAKVVEPLPEGTIVETFDNFEGSNSYVSGSFIGVNDITWNYVRSRGGSVNGKSIMFGALEEDVAGELSSESIPNGCGIISFNYMQAFSKTANFKILINDVEKGTFVTTTKDEVLNSGQLKVNVEGDFTIKFVQADGGNQVAIDDIAWTPYAPAFPTIDETGNPLSDASSQAKVYSTLGVINVEGVKMADVVVIDITGRVIATQVVEDNANISVKAGIYFVKVNNIVTKLLVQ